MSQKSFSNKFPLQLIKIPAFFAREKDSRKSFPIFKSKSNFCVNKKIFPARSHPLSSFFICFLYIFVYLFNQIFHLAQLSSPQGVPTHRSVDTIEAHVRPIWKLLEGEGERRDRLRGGCFINYESHDKVAARFCVVSKFFHSIKWDFQVKSVGTGG